MNEILKVVLSLSLSGSILILAIFLLSRLFKGRLSKRWHYYIWLVVIIRMFLPFSPETSLVGAISQGIETRIEQASTVPQQGLDTPVQAPPAYITEGDIPAIGENIVNDSNSGGTSPTAPAPPSQSFIATLQQSPWLIWLVVALILLIRKITIYQGFIKYIKAGCVEVANIDMLEEFGKIIEENNIKGHVELYTNSLVSTPLMIGFFRPCIVLPTANLPDSDFKYTILHELTHYKRGDMFYKWLVQITICLHWFNPLVYLMGHEINRGCELSCDEAVIAALDTDNRRDYGNTLLNAIGVGGDYKNSLASVTLGESKKLLKERLDSIMNFKKKSKTIISATVILSLVVCFCATYVGVYAAPYIVPSMITAKTQTSGGATVTPIKSVKVGFSTVAIDVKGSLGIEIVKTDKTEVSFELLNVEDEKACVTTAAVKDGTMKIAVDGGKSNRRYSNIKINNTWDYDYDYDYDYDDDDDYDDDYDYDYDDKYSNKNSLSVKFAPTYKNVIRVHVPNATYKEFNITADDVAVHIEDFKAPVKVNTKTGSLVLIDKNISQGSYDVNIALGNFSIEAYTLKSSIKAHVDIGNMDIDADSIEGNVTADIDTGNLNVDADTIKHDVSLNVDVGNMEISADTILKDVTANVGVGRLKMDFNKTPKNLYLDSTNCKLPAKRPTGWGSIYSVGNGTPKVTLSNGMGITVIED